MKHFSISHSEEYIKTPAYFPSQLSYEKSTLYTPIYDKLNPINSSLTHKPFISSLITMIGHERLLDSMSNFDYKERKKKELHNLMAEDRFIPSRKNLQKSYKLSPNKQNQQSMRVLDPQSLSIAQIYNLQVLGSKQIQLEQIQRYRNHNILKYKPENEKRASHEYHNKHSFICSPQSKLRKVNKVPCKVLDAPALQDDFYLNLIDWSQNDLLAVGLGNCIYLWNAYNSSVTKLCQLTGDMATSVTWGPKGDYLAIGCNSGFVQIWDVKQKKQIRKLSGHQSRVGSMAWNSKLLATGSRDKSILQRDLRIGRDFVIQMQHHTQEICGLKWSFDQQYIASGGNDNKVVLWSSGGQVLDKFSDHKAAVKALAWSPHQHGLLATGGGTADRMIKMRNVHTGEILYEKDAGSQVCNLAFSKTLHEIVSTHGYSEHQINIWSYPRMKKVATLIGHSHRVLYLAISPDGSTIVTGAGDQTLRFWNVFPEVNQSKKYYQTKRLVGEVELR